MDCGAVRAAETQILRPGISLRTGSSACGGSPAEIVAPRKRTLGVGCGGAMLNERCGRCPSEDFVANGRSTLQRVVGFRRAVGPFRVGKRHLKKSAPKGAWDRESLCYRNGIDLDAHLLDGPEQPLQAAKQSVALKRVGAGIAFRAVAQVPRPFILESQ